MSVKMKITCLGLACLLFLAAGCVETSTMYQGNTVSSVPIIALQEGGPHTGTWKTFDLIIDYKYNQGSEMLDISGQFALSEHYQTTYASVSNMFIYFFFLDKDSRVLETAAFPNTWYGGTEGTHPFSQSYKIPAEATGISFGYSGVAIERETKTSFYQLPLKKKSPVK